MSNFAWVREPEELREVADFFARIISLDPAYISHGEIQTGLSLDGVSWRQDLKARFRDDLDGIDESRSIAIVRDNNGALIGAAIVHWSLGDAEAPFATLEDLAVEPKVRSLGIGKQLTSLIEKEASERGAKWLFLESGNNNHRAHDFFKRAGFNALSQVFAKRL